MKLEVGKTYKTRNGEVVVIKDFNKSFGWPFVGVLLGEDHLWSESGNWASGAYTHPLDIVSEVIALPPSPPLKPLSDGAKFHCTDN